MFEIFFKCSKKLIYALKLVLSFIGRKILGKGVQVCEMAPGAEIKCENW